MDQIQKIIEGYALEKKWREEITCIEHILPVKEKYDDDDQKVMDMLRQRIKFCQDTLSQINCLIVRKKKRLQKSKKSR